MNYEDTLKLVTDLFEYKLDKANKAYIHHLIRVSESFEDEKLKITALLHDILEETSIDASCLEEMGYDKDIINSVIILTNTFDTYDNYIDNIIKSRNINAIQVKIKDLEDNMDMTRLNEIDDSDVVRLKKYKKAYKKLKEIVI